MQSPLVPVADTHGAGCAALTLSLLRGADIPAFVDLFHTSHLLSHQSFALGGMTISVPRSHAQDAVELIAAVAPSLHNSLGIRCRILLTVMFLSVGCGICSWALFPRHSLPTIRMQVLDVP